MKRTPTSGPGIPPRAHSLWALCAAAALAAGCAGPASAPSAGAAPPAPVVMNWPAEAAPREVPCPTGVPAGARCLRGQDSANSHYLIVMPEKWSGVLVVHAHGGPLIGTPTAARADEDIQRWGVTVAMGHAWAGSVFRQGGFAVTAAAEDTERVRRIFVDHVAKPRRTLLHGQSWGAMVATRAAEMFPGSWEGMLLTSGFVAGAQSFDFRLDFRVVYQHLCQNHPRPDEPAYPLAIGLPADSRLTTAEVHARADDCLGLSQPPQQRTAAQRQRLKTLLDVVRIPEQSIRGHLNWTAATLRDIAQRSGGSPFGNEGVRYRGSADDAALNAAVLRYRPDAAASARFSADVEHSGRFGPIPVLTTHGIGDGTVFVEGHHTLAARMQAAGNGARLVQTYVDSSEHSYLGNAIYPPLFEALLDWVEKGTKPTPQSIAQRCPGLAGSAAAAGCRFVPDYQVQPLASRVPPR